MSGERARLFVALELPGDVRGALIDWRSDALQGAPRLRLIAPEYLHVTLCFLGWQDEAEIPPIADACSAAESLPVASLALREAIWLPPRRPRVLAVELSDPAGTLRRIQASLSEALHAGGWYEPEGRPHLPHVTVARVPAAAHLGARALPRPPALGFLGREITLYRSHLARGGARYEPLAHVAL